MNILPTMHDFLSTPVALMNNVIVIVLLYSMSGDLTSMEEEGEYLESATAAMQKEHSDLATKMRSDTFSQGCKVYGITCSLVLASEDLLSEVFVDWLLCLC